MTLEILNAIVGIATLVVLASTALAAVSQIKHLRESNELDAFLRLNDALREPALRDAFRYVQTELPAKLEDPLYRAELATIGFVDPRAHPEMDACNWFNEVGALVKNRLVNERTFLDIFARLVSYYWGRLEPAIALVRRERGRGQYENFEYLAVLADAWRAKHPDGDYPASVPRKAPIDPWPLTEPAR